VILVIDNYDSFTFNLVQYLRELGAIVAVERNDALSIADIARHRQVLCITHLPQIAALADAHFVVDKTESRGRTHTSVKRLEQAERVEEIARMIGGIKVGDATRRAAAELLGAKD